MEYLIIRRASNLMDDQTPDRIIIGKYITMAFQIPYETKAYRIVATPDKIIEKGVPEKRRPIPGVLQGPPYLGARPMFDGESHEIDEFFEARINELGEASGKYMEIISIGNPLLSDPISKQARSKEQEKEDELATHEYREQVQSYLGEKQLKLMHMRFLIMIFEIRAEDLPCIAFYAYPPWGMILFKIKPKWYSESETARVFSKEFQSFLKALNWSGILKPTTTNKELTLWFSNQLNTWIFALDERIGDILHWGQPKYKEGYHCKALMNDEHCYCSIFEYNQLIDRKMDFNLFVDGHTAEYHVGDEGYKSKSGRLTPREFGILIELVKRADYIRPTNIVSSKSNEVEAKYKAFQRLRDKIDIKLEDNTFLIFKHHLPSEKLETGYKFGPPHNFKYCIIAPIY